MESLDRRRFLQLTGAGLAGLTLPGTSWGRARPAQPPNIVLILADDLGWAELGSYGNDFNETPHLDRLAAQGMRFTDAYAAPVCSPTRASIMTGQYPARTGITDFLAEKTDKYLHPERYQTINEVLSDGGYHTGIIGKWHLDTNFEERRGGPRAHGWDEVIATETKYIGHGDYFYPFDKVETLSGQDGDFLTDRLTDKAVDFIERNHGGPPFFLYLSHFSVHTHLDAPEALVEKYSEKHRARHGAGSLDKFGPSHLGRPDNPYLAAMTERMDAGAGRIMAALDDLGIAGDTLLIFVSDNGGDGRVTTNGPLRRAKTWVYEGGIRVPMIARWPGVVVPGSRSEEPVSTIDFLPTFGAAAGEPLPPRQTIDGKSLLPVLRGGGLERDTLFWHYPADSANWAERAAGAVRQGKYKLVEPYADGKLELFDLEEDIGEQNNLAEAMPRRTARMHNLLIGWRKGVGVDVPTFPEGG